MHLCKKGMKISLPTREGTCGLCHHVVVEILVMLKDPNTQGVPSAESSRSVRGLGKGVSGKPYPRLCNARRPRLEPGTFLSQALEVIDLLTKTCSKAQNYEQQCKRLVLKYTPLILVKGQKFLETTDVCSAIHACKAGTQASMEAMPLSATL